MEYDSDSTDVLVIPKRVVPRIGDLQPDEVSDLFLTVQRVSKVIEAVYKADALNIALQVSQTVYARRILRRVI